MYIRVQYTISRTLPNLSYCWIRLPDRFRAVSREKDYYTKPSSQSPFLFSSNFGKGPSHATRLMTVNISRAVVFKDCVFRFSDQGEFKYRLFNVLCWLWNIYEGAKLPSVLSLLDKFKVTSEHVVIIGHCPLM